MQRLTNLFSVLNDMEPICVLNHVFVLREVRLLSLCLTSLDGYMIEDSDIGVL
jgi:hypothetical protein